MEDTITDLPADEGDRIRWCQATFKRLQHSDTAKRLFLAKHKGKGYQISVWEFEGLYYIILCLRNEFKTFNDTIYINKHGEDSVNIAKFVRDNIDQIMKDYKDQITEARDALLRERLKVVGEADGDA